MNSTVFVKDIIENDTAIQKPEFFTHDNVPPSGFPAPKKRQQRTSAFKQKRQAAVAADELVSDKTPSTKNTSRDCTTIPSFEEEERRRIDQENRRRIESMSPAEIQKAKKELLTGLNPALIQKLLARANMDEPSGPSIFDPLAPKESVSQAPMVGPAPEIVIEDTSHPQHKNHSTTKAKSSSKTASSDSSSVVLDEDRPPARPPPDLFPLSELPEGTHFPIPPPLPDLDPSDPNFLETLHDKFFPNLPADPSKLAWMAPIPTKDSLADRESPYYPEQATLAVSDLRFDFRGALLPPRLSRSIPVSKGLHHHGKAPEAAGYTVEELAILARSAVPAQRCMAFQTLGRILYRLGKGEWGDNDPNSMASGIWRSVKGGRVIESLSEAAIAEGGHRGSQAYATEALWLLEQGGWRERWQGR